MHFNRFVAVLSFGSGILFVCSQASVAAPHVNQSAVSTGTANHDEMMRWWVDARRDKYGRYDAQAVQRAVEHRDRMDKVVRPEKSNGFWYYEGPLGLYRGNTTLKDFGPGGCSGSVNGILAGLVDQGKSSIFIATGSGGVWESLDSGNTWTSKTDSWPALETGCIATDQAGNVYVGTGDPYGFNPNSFGIMRSPDLGQTWTNLGKAAFGGQPVTEIDASGQNIDVTTANFAIGASLGGVFSSSDGGATWARGKGTPAGDWRGFAKTTSATSVVTTWAFGVRNGSETLYRRDPLTSSWTLANPPDKTRVVNFFVCGSPVHPDTLYAISAHADLKSGTIYRSSDAGSTWQDLSAAFPSGDAGYNWSQGYSACYIHASAVSGVDQLVVGVMTVVQSVDEGATWTDIGHSHLDDSHLHIGQRCMAADKSLSPNLILYGTEGGLFDQTIVKGKPVWDARCLSDGINIGELVSMDPSGHSGGLLTAGTIGSGLLVGYQGFGMAWAKFAPVDAPFALESRDGNGAYYVIASSPHQDLFELTNPSYEVYSSTPIQSGFPEAAPYFAPIALTSDGKTLLAATNTELHAYDLTLQTWKYRLGNIHLAGSGHLIRTIRTSPSNAATSFTGSTDGQVWATTNAGQTWQRVDAGLPVGAAIGAIEPSALSDNDLLVGVMSSGIHHLYLRTNITDVNSKWVDVSGSGANGLPDSPINALARDVAQPDQQWYVGTDVGVFQTINGGASYVNMNQFGLPNVPVTSLRLQQKDSLLFAGTYGRGSWRIVSTDSPTALSGLSIPATINEGQTLPATVTVTTPNQWGLSVLLTDDQPQALQIPTYTYLVGSQTQTTFQMTAGRVSYNTNVWVKATDNNATFYAKTTILRANANVTSVILNRPDMAGGNAVTGTVIVDKAAGPIGMSVVIGSNNPAIHASNVVIPSGANQTSFLYTSDAVTAQTPVTITAWAGGATGSAVQTLEPAKLTAFQANSPTPSGGAVNLTLTFDGYPPAGSMVQLTSDSSAVKVPATYAVSKASSFTLAVSSTPVAAVTQVKFTATHGATVLQASTSLVPAALTSITSSIPYSGLPFTLSVNLDGKAPVGGASVVLTSSDPVNYPVPASVLIPWKASSATLNLQAKVISKSVSVTFTGTYLGITKSLYLTINTAKIASLKTTPTTVIGGNSASGSVTLLGIPGADTVVSLTSGDTLYAMVPPSVTVLAGHTSASFKITTHGVDAAVPTPVSLFASLGALTATCTLQVGPPQLASITSASSSVTGGKDVTVTIKLNGDATYGGLEVTLSDDHSGTIIHEPQYVVIPKYGRQLICTWHTSTVSVATPVTITAMYPPTKASVTITVNPP